MQAGAAVIIAGCGYLGGELGTSLASRGRRVYGIRRNPAALPPHIEPLTADLTDRSTLQTLPSSSYLVYAAAPDTSSESAYRSTYVNGLDNVLSAWPGTSRAECRLILVSSTAVYAQTSGQWVDESSETQPTAFSGQLLLEAEARLRELACSSVILRLGGIYGPGRLGLLRRLRAGKLSLPARGQHTNRIHVFDAAAMIVHLLELQSPERVYLGVDDDPADQADVVAWLSAQTAIAVTAGGPAAARAGNKRCSNKRIRASGFALRYPSFRQGYGELLSA